MIDLGFKASVLKEDIIQVIIDKRYDTKLDKHFYLFKNTILLGELRIIETYKDNDKIFFKLKNVYNLEIPSLYEIQDDKAICANLNCSYLYHKAIKENNYYYNGKLGAIYTKEETTFTLFAPFANEVTLKLINKNNVELHNLVLIEKGIYSLKLKGDYLNYEYIYILNVDGDYIETVDPYAFSLSINSKRGKVVSLNNDIDFCDEKLKPINSNPLIYEMSVRDFTSSLNTNIENKGKFKGISEENRLSINNHPVGLDYLKYLGITHVQLLPVCDFLTTNELFPEKTYNWGYDANQMFALEGSYSIDVNDGLSRVIEFQKMVAKLHENNIRVILDMVFNHQFIKEYSSLDRCAKDYYYRFNHDGSLSNGSFCGNELESRNLMVRKYIVDCCKMFVEKYHVDGFRFDLMGLIDIDTIKMIEEECKKIRNDILLYGEGWDMPTSLDYNQRTTLNNAFKIESIGFFNDRYRDLVKGKSSDHELHDKGYLLGNTSYLDAFAYCFLGSSYDSYFKKMFNNPCQSINYIECHDNATLYDKLLVSSSEEDEKTRLKRINLLNSCLIFSYGNILLHSGQEIGLSKKGVYNSYNAGDEINSFDVNVLDKNFEMAKFLKEAIAIKKQYKFFNYKTMDEIKNHIKYDAMEGRIVFNISNIDEFENVKIIINPINEPYKVHLDSYYRVLFNEFGLFDKEFYAQNLTINGISLVILVKE